MESLDVPLNLPLTATNRKMLKKNDMEVREACEKGS
jgi:hypothetical protein